MLLKNLNKKILLTTTLILLVGFFGYSQVDKSTSKINKNLNQLNNEIKIESLNNKKKKHNVSKEDNNSLHKEIKSKKLEPKEIAVRFQERWLLVSLLA